MKTQKEQEAPERIYCMCGEEMEQVQYPTVAYRWACLQADKRNYPLHIPQPKPDLLQQPASERCGGCAEGGSAVTEPPPDGRSERQTFQSNYTQTAKNCINCGHDGFSDSLQRCVRVIHVQDGEFQCGCKCVFPATGAPSYIEGFDDAAKVARTLNQVATTGAGERQNIGYKDRQRHYAAINAANATPASPSTAEGQDEHDSCSHWRDGDSDHCVCCGDDLGPTTEADVAGPSTPTTGAGAREAARQCAYEACRYFDELYLASSRQRADGVAFDTSGTDPIRLAARLLPLIAQHFPPTEATQVAVEAAASEIYKSHASQPGDGLSIQRDVTRSIAAIISKHCTADAGEVERPTTPLLRKIFELADLGSAQEFNDAQERLLAIRGLIVGENV